MAFVHLHNHSHYSLLDGVTTPEEMCRIAAENGQTHIALTDHGSMAGMLALQVASAKHDINPIFGVEAYYSDVALDDPDATKHSDRFHMILLAMNDRGLENMLEIQKIAWVDNFYYKPLTNFDHLRKYNEGIGATSSCMGGIISKLITAGDEGRAEQIVDEMLDIFGDRFYVEVQPWNGFVLNNALMDIADAKNIPIIGTMDCHYPTVKHKEVEEALLCVGTWASLNAGQKRHVETHRDQADSADHVIDKLDILYPDRRLRFYENDHYIAEQKVVESIFAEAGITRTDIFENTQELAERCTAKINTKQNLLPVYNPKLNSDEYLRDICEFRLQELGLTSQEYLDRLEEELGVIISLKFSDYFLVVWDLVTWAKNNNIWTGWGRGSAAGSLVSYSLGITKVDPIRWDLSFYRFLSPDRNDYPDIDLDFEDRRRNDVKQYLKDKWGHDNVAGIATYIEFGGKSVVSDLSRIFGVTPKETLAVTQHFATVEEFMLNKEVEPFRKKNPHITRLAQALDGRIAKTGAHPSGIVVSSKPLSSVAPIETRVDPADKKSRIPVTSLDMNWAELLGLLKFDILGLKNLSVVHDCVDKVREIYDVNVVDAMTTWDDPQVFDWFSRGNTAGVFQTESTAYRNLLLRMGVEDFNDLAASNALVRPGALLTQTEPYIRRKKGLEPVHYEHDRIKLVTESTYGVFIYQEQIMKLAVVLGGLSESESDKLRKIIGKKRDGKEFDQYRDKFVAGATEHVSDKVANKIFDDFVKFSGYGFNKSHAIAYSMLSYVTMWLKIYYPKEYFWAMLVNENDGGAVGTYLIEAGKHGIEILPPDINKSAAGFTISEEGVRFGLESITGVGPAAVAELLAKRPFSSYEECIEKCQKRYVKSNVLEAMEKVGAFDGVGHDSPWVAREYYLKLLNYPIEIAAKSEFDEMLDQCSHMSEQEKEKVYGVVKAVVKSTKRTPTYFRVELEDLSGAVTVFANKDMEISTGDCVYAFVGNKGLHSFVNVFDIPENEDHPLVQYMRGTTPLKDFPYVKESNIGGLNDKKAIIRIVGKREFITKAGKPMSWLDIESLDGFGRMTLFYKEHEYLFKKIKVLGVYLIKPQWSGTTLTIESNGLISWDQFMEMKNAKAKEQ